MISGSSIRLELKESTTHRTASKEPESLMGVMEQNAAVASQVS